jgi:hypothetical protein
MNILCYNPKCGVLLYDAKSFSPHSRQMYTCHYHPCSYVNVIWFVSHQKIAYASSCSYWSTIESHSTSSSGFTVSIYLNGGYNSSGSFCGEMNAEAIISIPTHGVDGYLYADLETCNSHTASSASSYVPTGGLYGTGASAETSNTTISCGSAAAYFQGSYSNPISISVGTGNWNG